MRFVDTKDELLRVYKSFVDSQKLVFCIDKSLKHTSTFQVLWGIIRSHIVR